MSWRAVWCASSVDTDSPGWPFCAHPAVDWLRAWMATSARPWADATCFRGSCWAGHCAEWGVFWRGPYEPPAPTPWTRSSDVWCVWPIWVATRLWLSLSLTCPLWDYWTRPSSRIGSAPSRQHPWSPYSSDQINCLNIITLRRNKVKK